MPRASRYMLAGYTYHITHRCADRRFLLRFARDRDAYREWLRVGARRYGVPVYAYAVTSNHAHVIVHAGKTEAVAGMMQLVAGATARQYNRRKERTGPFWEDRYHCTIVQGGRHLWNCLRYVDLNMVRAGVVAQAGEWRWCGHDELMGARRRYRLLDVDGLVDRLGGGRVECFRSSYAAELQKWASLPGFAREPAWTESLAVGSREFVESVQSHYRWRSEFSTEEITDAMGSRAWMVREEGLPYGGISEAKSASNGLVVPE